MSLMKIWLAYGHPTRPVEIPLEINGHCSVAWAIRYGYGYLLKHYPELPDLNSLKIDELKIGIYARRVSLDTVLQEGDRVEIYCPLQLDPKEARLRRALKNKKN